jgi:hypothetical protein
MQPIDSQLPQQSTPKTVGYATILEEWVRPSVAIAQKHSKNQILSKKEWK